jgi:hypothetical protein
LLLVEQDTLTVFNTVETTVTRAALLATPTALSEETIPPGTPFTMTAGDFWLRPPNSGGELRNDGTEDVVLLAPPTTEAAKPVS